MSFWRRFRAILWIVIAFLALGLGAAYLGQSWFASSEPPSSLGRLGGPFIMTDHTGRRVSEQDFAGRTLILFFGFTRCPDVCPTALTAMTELLAELGPLADRLTPVFVSIDPERDTPDVLRDYVGAFDARILGLTGSVDEVAAMAKAWRVYYRKVPTSRGEDYTMDHSTLMYLMDRYGKLREVFNLHGGEDLAGPVAKIRQILTS